MDAQTHRIIIHIGIRISIIIGKHKPSSGDITIISIPAIMKLAFIIACVL